MDAAKIERMRVMNGALACFGSDYYQTQKNLKLAGWIQLGAGNYGSAWEPRQGGDYVLKVCGRVSGDSYPAWAVFCEANPMPGLPETEFCTFNDEREQFMCMMPRYVEVQHELYDVKGAKGSLYEELCGIVEYGWMEGCNKWNNETSQYVHHVPSNRPEVKAAIAASEFFRDLVQWDFHRGNAMWDDRKGLLVITDPIHQGNNEPLIHKVRTGSLDVAGHTRQLVRQDRLMLEGGQADRVVPPGLHRGEVQMVAAGQAQVKLDGGREFRFELPNIQQLPKGWVAKQEGDIRAAADWVRAHGLSKEKV